ncbi:MAG: lytic transglycosylase domain-containing protein [Candidatus Cloacimonetes bacterium]|nr:lytic transglycosylase domain-containing protein [Candidatus Cloacimonadota bacterium]
MKFFIFIILSVSLCTFAETDYFGLSTETTDYFGDIAKSGSTSNDFVLVVEKDDNQYDSDDDYFQNDSDDSSDTSNKSDYIDEQIKEAKQLNTKKKFIEALDLLRVLNFQVDFNNIKAQYYFARQYLIVIGNKAIQSDEYRLYFKKAKHHIKKIETHIENGNVSRSEKSNYEKKVRELKLLYSKLLPKSSKPRPSNSSNDNNDTDVNSPNGDTFYDNDAADDDDDVVANLNDNEISQDNLAASKAPIYNLQLSSADQIDSQHAKTILDAMGLTGSNSVHKLSYSNALAAVCNGKTYGSYRRSYTGPNGTGCKGIGLNDKKLHKYHRTATMKQYLFEEYQLLRTAVIKYKAYPVISYKDTPKLYENWINKAAAELTSVPQSKRVALLQSQLREESGRAHWRNFRPIASQAGAVGVAQLLPATAIISSKVNPYDPEGNFVGGAKYLNKMIKNHGSIKSGLAAYNGGGGNVNAAGPQRYARNITSRM